MGLDYADRTDFDNATRGLVDRLDPCTVEAADGRLVWDLRPYDFLDGERPDTVHPGLWRQARLCRVHGLFEVTGGIYQVRGLDISNMTLVEGNTGVIVIDPLTSAETAAAAIALYRRNRGNRPVTGVIYTHSHIDHFGGVPGVLPEGAGEVPILAPEGFLAHAVSENVYAGTAMARRASYMYGAPLGASPAGQVSNGLGIALSRGSIGLIAPTTDITHTGQEETVDGVRMVFQLTPGTEAPAEMNFHFPGHRALCLAENATHNLHNLLTLRGAQVRDPRRWSRYLNEAIELFASGTDVAFASHHWPTWGTGEIVRFLTEQRDLYAFLHDQTLRLLNNGLTGAEIAERFTLPPALESAWHARGYYGSVSHNVKAVYQRYLGWFDGHPSSLWPHPPEAAAVRYVEVIGGQQAVRDKARRYADEGDLRFAAELLKHAVFADPGDDAAREALAEVYEKLGYGSENATWRTFYLTGAHELRHGVERLPLTPSRGLLEALTVEQVFDALAIRVDGLRAAAESLVIDWRFTDSGTTVRLALSHGALIQTGNPKSTVRPDLTLTLAKRQLPGLLAGQGLDDIGHEGDLSALTRLRGLLQTPDESFPIVTP
ncbi:MBL fold metallo-hydrolase [Amycolatopsis rhizosphaerae]|uniref:MBL fold metallo-hydrolase n=1 Tax=Amycolatopsis rhizosphaerae TaxID=2053003 RepID=A0A558CS32_9PSEU|nr:alkyl sulfatase dimerization domain-containing protein [Amycolatopsis rhizosphaerae]TVT51584.1 MBL fold metallo-hydrolase [Amycolatopsis rhizosphaerae]